jgi:hypothetical protein
LDTSFKASRIFNQAERFGHANGDQAIGQPAVSANLNRSDREKLEWKVGFSPPSRRAIYPVLTGLLTVAGQDNP